MERLSGMDALFLYLETPTQHMHVTLCAVLDPRQTAPGFGFEHIRDHLADRMHLVPALTRRLVPIPLRLHHPLWVDDAAFVIDDHVHRVRLPAPGTDEQLAELTAQIASVPLDRSRPLWQAWVVEGLADGHLALIAKVHHAGLDGVAGVEQLVTLFDFEREPEPIAAPAPPVSREPEEIPSGLELVTWAAVSRLKSALDLVPLVGRTASSIRAVRTKRAEPDAPIGGTPLGAPRTGLNGPVTAGRSVAFARLALDDIKRVQGAVPGATINDVILAVCAGAMRRYLDARDELPTEPLLAACPVNVRTAQQGGRADNRLSALFTPLPTHIADPLDRLEAAHRAARAAKEEHGLFDHETLQQWAEVSDPNVLTWLADGYASSGFAGRHRPPVNLLISNVPGPPFPLYLAGSELVRAYPMGQIIEGVGLNITVMSYRSSVDFGFMAAANLVPDIAELAAAVDLACTELLDAIDAIDTC